jgi:hypothetical protein
MASEISRDLVSKTAGLHCRADDCPEVFVPENGWDRAALIAAIERRDAHELEAHDYRHVRGRDEETPTFSFARKQPLRE